MNFHYSFADAEGDKVSTGLQAVALDILQTLVRAYGVVSNSKSGENPTIQSRPLSQILVVNAFPAAVKCTLRSDDNAVTQVSSTILSFIGCKIMHSVTVSRKIVIFLGNYYTV